MFIGPGPAAKKIKSKKNISNKCATSFPVVYL